MGPSGPRPLLALLPRGKSQGPKGPCAQAHGGGGLHHKSRYGRGPRRAFSSGWPGPPAPPGSLLCRVCPEAPGGDLRLNPALPRRPPGLHHLGAPAARGGRAGPKKRPGGGGQAAGLARSPGPPGGKARGASRLGGPLREGRPRGAPGELRQGRHRGGSGKRGGRERGSSGYPRRARPYPLQDHEVGKAA
jgi:hypothetical protein